MVSAIEWLRISSIIDFWQVNAVPIANALKGTIGSLDIKAANFSHCHLPCRRLNPVRTAGKAFKWDLDLT